MTRWTSGAQSGVTAWGLPSAWMQRCMARKSRYSSNFSWYFMSLISEKTWQTMRRRRVKSFRTSASSISNGRQQYFLKTSMGVSEQKLLAKESSFCERERGSCRRGNWKIRVISCSCSRTRSSFLPISWKRRKSRFDRSPISLLTLLQTSSTVSQSVILITMGSSSNSVSTQISIFSAASFFRFSSSSASLSWKRSRPRRISVPQRMVKASFSSRLVRQLRLMPLMATVWARLTRFSQELRARRQKSSGKLRRRRKQAGSFLMSSWLKSFWKIWQMTNLRVSMVLLLWLLSQFLLSSSSPVILRPSLQWRCRSATMAMMVEKRRCSSFFRSRNFTSTIYSVYFLKEVDPISSVPSTLMHTSCAVSRVIAFSCSYTYSARLAFTSSLPVVKVVKPSEWMVIMLRQILLSSSRRTKKSSFTRMRRCSLRVASSTTSSKSLNTTRLTSSGRGSRISVSVYSLRNSRFSWKMGNSGVENSRSSWFMRVRRMILSTSSLTCVSIFLKLACTSTKACQSRWAVLVFFMISWKSISQRAMRKVGCRSQFSATLFVPTVYWRQISPISLLERMSSWRKRWADSALRMQSVQSLKKGMNLRRMGAQSCSLEQLAYSALRAACMASWKSLISTIDENSFLTCASLRTWRRSMGSFTQVMYSISPRMYFSSPSISCRMFIFRSLSRSCRFFSICRQRQISFMRQMYLMMKRRFPFSTASYCFPMSVNRRTELSRFTAIDPESDLLSSSTALLSWERLDSNCRDSVSSRARVFLWPGGEDQRSFRSWRTRWSRTAASSRPFSMNCSMKKKGSLSMYSAFASCSPKRSLRASSSKMARRVSGSGSSPSWPSEQRRTKRQMSLQVVTQAGMAQKTAVLTTTSSPARRYVYILLASHAARAFQVRVYGSSGQRQQPARLMALAEQCSRKSAACWTRASKAFRDCSQGDYYCVFSSSIINDS